MSRRRSASSNSKQAGYRDIDTWTGFWTQLRPENVMICPESRMSLKRRDFVGEIGRTYKRGSVEVSSIEQIPLKAVIPIGYVRSVVQISDFANKVRRFNRQLSEGAPAQIDARETVSCALASLMSAVKGLPNFDHHSFHFGIYTSSPPTFTVSVGSHTALLKVRTIKA